MNWIKENWPKSTIFLAVYVTITLILFVARQNFALFLIWIQMPVYFLHQFEEYNLPGGFLAFFNTKMLGSPREDFPLDTNASFWINMPIIYVGFLVFAILATLSNNLNLGVWIAYFSVINALSHVVMFFKFRYNPGFVVSLFVNIPVGIFTIYYFAAHQIVSTGSLIIGFIIGLAVQLMIMFYGFKILKPKIAVRKDGCP